jgi:hypothetical protein
MLVKVGRYIALVGVYDMGCGCDWFAVVFISPCYAMEVF